MRGKKMIDKVIKALKKSNKKRNINITIGTVIGFLLSCTTIIGAGKEMAGLEIKKENGIQGAVLRQG